MNKLIIEDSGPTIELNKPGQYRYVACQIEPMFEGMDMRGMRFLVSDINMLSHEEKPNHFMSFNDGYSYDLVWAEYIGMAGVNNDGNILVEVKFLVMDGNNCDCHRIILAKSLFQAEFIKKGGNVTVVERISIGSDIEFHFVKDGQTINSGTALVVDTHGEIGNDHGGSVGEIRPQFAFDPIEHANNIEKVLTKLIEGGMLKPDVFLDSSHSKRVSTVVGGHLHFGIKDSELIKACHANLDYWLAATIMPLFPKDNFIQRTQNYGKINGEPIRTNNHGFEYRVIPSFIFDKGIAKGILCLAFAIVKLTAEKRLKVRLQEKDSRYLQKFYDDYNKHNISELSELREENIKLLLNKNLLGGLVKYINPLFDAIKYGAEYSGDIAEGWGLEYNYVLNRGNESELYNTGLTVEGSLRIDSRIEEFNQRLQNQISRLNERDSLARIEGHRSDIVRSQGTGV